MIPHKYFYTGIKKHKQKADIPSKITTLRENKLDDTEELFSFKS